MMGGNVENWYHQKSLERSAGRKIGRKEVFKEIELMLEKHSDPVEFYIAMHHTVRDELHNLDWYL